MRSSTTLLPRFGMGIGRCLEHHRKRRAIPVASVERVST
jgi:hypothetical protein